MYAIFVSIKIKPERREDFLKAIEIDARGSREDEPGCMRFDVLQDMSDPDQYYFYEVYRDEAAFKAHGEAPHYKVWADAVQSGVVAERGELKRTRSVFPTDGEWK